MNALVLSDLTWFLPKVLQKVPWQVRATFLAVITVFGAYAIGAPLFGWPLSRTALSLLGVLAVPAGLPALANVTVHPGTAKPDQKDVTALVEELSAQVKNTVAQLHGRLDAQTTSIASVHDHLSNLQVDVNMVHDKVNAAGRVVKKTAAPVKKATARAAPAKKATKKTVAKKG